MGGIVSPGIHNDDLVDKLKGANYIKSAKVEKVFRLVDRGRYLTEDDRNGAYHDNAWRSGNLHISAPCIYAQVMEGLELGVGMSFLNIGSGTGYLSTMAGLVIGPNGINHGIELYSDVVEYAKKRLKWFLTNSDVVNVSFFCEPQFHQGNALSLKEDKLLYDRVYCGASCPTSHEAFMKNLIKVNGVLVMPRNDKLLKITRTAKTTWTTEFLLPVSFSSLVMPNHSLPVETAELPPVCVISLQELTREVIRSIFRSQIEATNKDLKGAFIHKISSETSRDCKHGCQPSRSYNQNSITDTEYASDASEEGDNGGSGIDYRAQRLQVNQLSAFLELARSVRRHNDRVDQERGDEEESEGNGSNESGNEEMFYVDAVQDDDDNNGENLFDAIDSMVGAAGQPPPASKEEGSVLQDKDAAAVQAPPNEEESLAARPSGSRLIIVTNEDGVESEVNLEARRHSDENVMLETKAKTSNEFHSTALAPSTSNQEQKEEYDGDEDGDEVMVAVSERRCSYGHSNGKKKDKTREKFDSGVVADLDTPMGMDEDSSSSSSHAHSSSISSSSSDFGVTGYGSCKALIHNSENADCTCSGDEPWRWWTRRRRRRHLHMRKRRTTNRTEDEEARTDSSGPIGRYTTLMRDRIQGLPLPLPLKTYVNYNRPL